MVVYIISLKPFFLHSLIAEFHFWIYSSKKVGKKAAAIIVLCGSMLFISKRTFTLNFNFL